MAQTQQPTPQQPSARIPDYPDYLMSQRVYLADRYKTILVVLMISMNIVANVLATQMWYCGPLPLDCGVFVYPVIYVSLDVINEVYRKDIANQTVGLACIANLITIGAIWLASFVVQNYGTGADHTNVITVFNFSIRTFFASTVAFVFSSVCVNNDRYAKLREKTDDIGKRAFKSSFPARIVDSLFFSVIAFYGRVDNNLLMFQFIASFGVALAIEACCTPIKVRISEKINPIVNGQTVNP